MQYAKIESSYVTNVAVGQPDSSWILTDGTVSIGDSYDGSVFTPKPQPEQPKAYSVYDYADFVEALTDSGAARKIIIAKKADAGADLEVFMEIARSRGVVDFNNATTLMRLNGLVPAMLTQEQADEITGE